MSSRRLPAVLLLAVALGASLLACGDDEPAATTDSSSTTAPVSATAPATADASTVTTAIETTVPPTTQPTTTEPGEPTVSCDEGTTLSADVDGDGTVDAVALVTDPSAFTSELRVCTAAGTIALDALGATTVDAADIDGDGAAELLYGGSGATSRTVQVAQLVDGNLLTVTVDGAPLILTDGYPDGTPPDGPRHAFGCGGTVDGTAVHVIVLRVTPINAAEHTFSLDATGYRLEGGTAVLAGTQTVTSAAGTPGGTPEELIAYANEIVAEQAPAC
jgi:hypothetical protein